MTDSEGDRTHAEDGRTDSGSPASDAESATGVTENVTGNFDNFADDAETATSDADPVASDPEVARQLSNIHQTLELVALLLAVLLAGSGGIGTIAGGCAIVLLVGNAITRAIHS